MCSIFLLMPISKFHQFMVFSCLDLFLTRLVSSNVERSYHYSDQRTNLTLWYDETRLIQVRS
ncbi:hypothetical protein KC19_VG153500 [Ceratodon purpureus]|uniref:Uncharacterized protein n=1 Tax=Ceratodon purpureus TaxID=3225 RepID=A0A8T0HQB8_CERPU|nr:hypothetical protein KC19_VG153500 [Ceratodon purpureus]